jgi:hypothetical protein
MMQYQIYQLWAAERDLTPAERYAADTRRGELAAATSRSVSRAGRHIRAIGLRRSARHGHGLAGAPRTAALQD